MLKNIKKSIKYFIIVLGVFIMLPTVLYLLLQTSTVQTFLVKKITSHFSNQIKSTISIGSIEYRFFNKLSVNDILIKDRNNDTLIYSEKVILGIKRLDFKKNSFRLGRVSLLKPVISLVTDSSGMMNLSWYLNLLKNPSDTIRKTGSRFSIDQIDIDNARFSLINRTGQKSKTKMDFNNLNITGLNGIIEDLRILNDTTSFNIYNLGFKESSGFSVRKMSSTVTLARQNILLNSISINCDSSIINISRFGLAADSASSFKKFTEKVKLDMMLEKSLINTSDLQYFIPYADSLNESVWLSGKVFGTISELRGRNIKLKYRNYTSLDCDFDFSGLPRIENTFLYIGVNTLKTNAIDFEQIRYTGKEPFIVPEVLKKLGNISFNGSFTGFASDFVTYGELRTTLGNIRTDISLRPGESKKYMVKGLLKGSNINIGELTGNSELLGNLSMHANVDGYAYSLNKFAASLTGKIDSIEVNKYLYRNISLNGNFTEKMWDGNIKIDDRNIKLDLIGLLNFKNKMPEFDFKLNIADANLFKLNFDKLDSSSRVTLLLTSNFKGNSIDNLDGEIKLLNSRFRKYSNNLELNDFSIKTYKDSNGPVLSLRTDFVDADINGYYNFATIGSLIQSTLVRLMPSQFHDIGKRYNTKKNNFTFKINFKNTDKINNFLKTGIILSDKSYIDGAVLADSIIHIGGKADLLTIKNNTFKVFSFDAKVSGSELSIGVNSNSLNLLSQSEFKNFSIDLKTKPDNFTFKLNWDNKDKILNQGNFIARGTIANSAIGKKYATLSVAIDSSHIYAGNDLWKVSNSSILIDSNAIKVNKLAITSNDRSYLVDGTVSQNPADTLNLEFNGIDIDPLNYWINRKKSSDLNQIPLNFKGHLNGKILLTNVYKSLLLAGNIIIDNFSVLGSDFGRISINANLDNAKKIVNILASNNLNSVKMFDVSGKYDPAIKKIDLTARATKLPVGFLNPLLKVFASDISGFATGRLKLSGETDNLVLQGSVMAENTSMKINYLQTKYILNDSIRFDKQGFKFNNVRLTDVDGNTATLYGSVYHKNFQSYTADLIININNNPIQVLNTQQKDNPMFYGTAYASGVAKIKIDPSSLSFDISAKTGKSTKSGRTSKLSIPLNKGLSVSEYSFISFIDSGKNKKNGSRDSILAPTAVKQIPMELNMNLEITPDAEIQIIFDSKAGDVMKGTGSSENLNINLNKKGDFNIFGDYIIEKGDYTFTLVNFLNKTFNVESGGKIMFSGNIKDADIELKANYSKLKTSLAPVLGEDDKYKERISVEPQLSLSGKLFNPIVGFDIYLPEADEETRTSLRNAISTQEELNRQVFSLLIMGGFISMGPSSIASSATGTSAMYATTFEMVSNQLSNWLSQISKDFDIGFVYRPGYNAINPQEVQLALSTQLLNDKVVLNGNFDVRGPGANPNNPTSNTNQLIGDFDAEIRLTEKLKFKVFNRYNDISPGGLSPYTQGVGIFYKQDFNKFSDLFRKKVKSDLKKEEETKMKNK
jgi:hypothetical protein